VEVPHSQAAGPTGIQAGYRRDDPYGLSERERFGYENLRREPEPREGGLSGAAAGWLIFILIFGVGNLILYMATGWFIIPIPRR
jgi:hypothetical protein